MTVERLSASAAYAGASFTVVSEQGRQLKSENIELQQSERIMANPEGRVLLDEEQARAAEERYARMEATLQELQQQNQELQRCLQEQQEIINTERLRADHRSRAQTQEFANLTAELLAGRRGPELQMEGMRMGVKVEKPEAYDGDKSRDLDT